MRKISEVRRSGSNFPSPLKILAGSFPSDSVYKRKSERKEQMGAFGSPGETRPVGTGPHLVKTEWRRLCLMADGSLLGQNQEVPCQYLLGPSRFSDRSR
jgi:hypothetical protein